MPAIAVRMLALLAAVTLASLLPAQDPGGYDLVLRGGRIVDVDQRAIRDADVALRNGTIAAIGEVERPPGTPVIDLRGAIVAPGFIDLHTHVDADVTRTPSCPNFLRMGVTTILTGNCGSSMKDLDKHFARLDKGGVGVNYGSLIGLGTVRRMVLGTANRAPSEAELQRMCGIVEAGMKAGAFGVSTGLIYVPGIYAERDELCALAAVAGKHRGIYVSHMRNEADRILAAIDEALAICRFAGTPVHVSHIKCSGKNNHGRADEVLRRLIEARDGGMRVTADQYAYTASSTGLDVLFPSAELDVGRAAFAKRLREDAAFRAQMHAALLRKMEHVGFGDFGYCRIASARGNEDLNGMLLPAAAGKRLGRDDRDAQAELAIELLIAAAPKRVGMVYHKMIEADVERFLSTDWIAVASDSGIRRDDSKSRPHPRGSGNNPRVLARYVRERAVVDLPTAIAKMTSLPADILGLSDRGRLAVGKAADLVVFDPEQVSDRASYAEPTLHPDGIRMVLVNGRIAVDRNRLTGVRAGHVLRRGR